MVEAVKPTSNIAAVTFFALPGVQYTWACWHNFIYFSQSLHHRHHHWVYFMQLGTYHNNACFNGQFPGQTE